MTYFKAHFLIPYPFTAPFTAHKLYDVIDFNSNNGTYTVIDDNGERKSVDWNRFIDQGRKAREYERAR